VQGAPENSCRPAVDVLFRSVAESYGGAAVAAVLTGMGQDGLRGVQLLKARGAYITAQDEASSVVWGMPGFVARSGLADAVLDLHRIVPAITHHWEARAGRA
jgi:two-component system chemotaxis response regulator CheB